MTISSTGSRVSGPAAGSRASGSGTGSRASSRGAGLTFHPLTPDRWANLEALFGPRGACGGCWCMAWRLAPSEFGQRKGDGNRRALRALVTKGQPTGILAYEGADPIGWCAVAPREATPRLERSKVLARLDALPVWSVTCFFVAREHRKQGVTVALLRAAAVHARKAGARILEGYPVEPRQGELPAAFAWTGLASAFREAGFVEVARRSATRPIFRLTLRKGASPRAATSIIEQERVFAATPAELFLAFADPKLHAAFTGSAATGRARAGARFTAWDGYISGRTVEVEPGRRIVQEWRTTDWPDGALPSRLDLSFFDHPRGARVVLRQTDVPRTQARGYRDGWSDYYWKPLRTWLTSAPRPVGGRRAARRS